MIREVGKTQLKQREQ